MVICPLMCWLFLICKMRKNCPELKIAMTVTRKSSLINVYSPTSFLNWDTAIYLLYVNKLSVHIKQINCIENNNNNKKVLGENQQNYPGFTCICYLNLLRMWIFINLIIYWHLWIKPILNAVFSTAENISVYYTCNLANEAELGYREIP